MNSRQGVVCLLLALTAVVCPSTANAQATKPQPARPHNVAKPAPVVSAPVRTPALVTAPLVLSPARFVVVLDAAHGGTDAGAHLRTQAEKAFTLSLSVRLRSLLSARGISTVTTRESDATVLPNRRIEIANQANAQACISLHASENGSGVHIFISSLQPKQETSRYTAWKTAQAAWVNRSLALAGVLESGLQHANINVMPMRTVLPVIDSMSCPAVDIEVAPDKAANDPDNAKLDSTAYQSRIAEALAVALLEWRSSPTRTEDAKQ